MSSFRNTVLVLLGLALLIGASPLFGQATPLYGDWPTQLQTRNIPAGSVQDPGSSLLYIIDTGVNLREAQIGGDSNLVGFNAPLSVVNQGTDPDLINPFGVGGSQSVYNDDGTLNPNLVNRNFIAITNAHPTAAVTVHFRYFNDECQDLLDFLVLLTCNDTLIFDPFNFTIPGTNLNTRARIFGPAQGILQPISAGLFGSGRFIIFATASGTSFEPQNSGIHDDNAELRFPDEFRDFIDEDDHCDNLQDDTYFGLNPGIRPDNLHVFNASAVAFNYLIGNWTTAVPFGNVFQAHGLNAWTRPAVDLTNDDADAFSQRPSGPEPDGDGPPLTSINDFRILTGNEDVFAANGASLIQRNFLYLRNEVHGGDTARINNIPHPLPPGNPTAYTPDGRLDYDSWYGALGNTSLFGAPPGFADPNTFHFLSIADDYNGSGSAFPLGIGLSDNAYRLNGARTRYVLQIYNWDEILFDVVGEPPINVSPPVPGVTAALKITVDCLRTWITDVVRPGTSVDSLQIEELDGIAAGISAFLSGSGNPLMDASRGWIRFVRDNSLVSGPNPQVTDLYGTYALFEDVGPPGNDSFDDASFATIGYQTVGLGGFGAAWWLNAVPSIPLVSDTGDPQCLGACPNPTQP